MSILFISPTPIDADRLASDEGSLVRRKECDHRRHLIRAAKAADRNRLGALRDPISRSSPYSRRLVLIAREVRIGPGQTALTVIPHGAKSKANDLVKPTIAAFEAA